MSVQEERAGTVYGFKPLPWQQRFVSSMDGEVVGSGAFGAGKTRALGEKVYVNLTAWPGNVGLLCRKTYASLQNTTLQTLLDEVIPESHIVGSNKQKHVLYVQSPFYPVGYCSKRDECGWQTTSMVAQKKRSGLTQCPKCEAQTLQWTPPSRLYYAGLNTGSRPGEMPSNVAGMNLGFVAVDEAIEIAEKEWMMLLGRLRLEKLRNPWVPELPVRQIFSATNPDGPNHWMHKRFYDKGVGTIIEASTADNIHNPDDYLERLRTQYSGADYDRLVRGEWVGNEGLVYSDFSDAIHVIEPLDVPGLLGDGWTVGAAQELQEMQEQYSTQTGDPNSRDEYVPARIYPPEDTTIYMGIDWGYRPDPLVVQWWADTSRYGLVLYREMVKTRTLPDDAAADAVDHMALHEIPNVAAVFADHDPGDRKDWGDGAYDAISERKQREAEAASLSPYALETSSAVKDRSEGVKHVTRLLRPDENNRAGLHFIRGARCHQIDTHLFNDDEPADALSEIRGYQWQQGEEVPEDGQDHSMDTMRYVAYSKKEKGPQRSTGTAVFKS